MTGDRRQVTGIHTSASMKMLVRFLLCLCLASSSFADDPWTVRMDGVGPVRIGMTLPQLNEVLHEKFAMPAQKDEQACFYVTFKVHPHVALMIEDGRLSRIDVYETGMHASSGLQVGDSEAKVREVYGSKLEVEPHHYDDGHYLTALSSDRQYGIRFETDKKTVKMFYAGRYKSVQYVEGCQ